MQAAPEMKRSINRRGEGAKLQAEIVDAAARLLAETFTSNSLTLRAIAREAGIAPPSIYPHFQNRDAVIDAVIERAFNQLDIACSAIVKEVSSGVAKVEAICSAYLAWASERPGQYRVLFERSRANSSAPPRTYATGLEAFALLVEALRQMKSEGASQVDPEYDAQSLWLILHGLVTLVPANPGFPWMSLDDVVPSFVRRLAAVPRIAR